MIFLYYVYIFEKRENRITTLQKKRKKNEERKKPKQNANLTHLPQFKKKYETDRKFMVGKHGNGRPSLQKLRRKKL